MTDFYPGDTYDTPELVKRAFREYLLLGSRWSPYSFFFYIILKYRAIALKGTYDYETWAESSFEQLTYLESCGAKFHVKGMDNIRKLTGPVVYVANHMSTLETLALPGFICPIQKVTYVVKEKLTKGFFWGPIMRSRDPITVTRKDPRADLESVLNGGMERLKNGISVIIFPQGTRQDHFDRAKFNSLGVKLAARAGVPVVPVALKTDWWGNSKILRGFGPVRRKLPIMFEFGEPIPVSGRGKAEHERCLEFIESRLRSWGADVVDSGSSEKAEA
jgi:1-acyl-sn-glycerol-3-phosphate acyltransferase